MQVKQQKIRRSWNVPWENFCSEAYQIDLKCSIKKLLLSIYFWPPINCVRLLATFFN